MTQHNPIADDIVAIIKEFADDAGYLGPVALYSPLCLLGLDWLDRSQILDRLEQHFDVMLEDEPHAAATVADWIEMVGAALHDKQLMEGAVV